MSSSGLRLAVRYSLPSCRLGFCGPRDKESQKILVDFASGEKIPQGEVRKILEKFEAMYPYLRLIASSNQIPDPFDERVVKALWVGNGVLDGVKVDNLRRMVVISFTKPGLLSRKEAERRAAQIPEGAVPHHSFHVLFLGSVTGRVKLEGALKDLCRISWGEVVGVGEGSLRVRYRPLLLAGKPSFGGEMEKEIEWDERIVPGIKRGDRVSFHWGQVCDLLNKEDVANLTHYTQKAISLLLGK